MLDIIVFGIIGVALFIYFAGKAEERTKKERWDKEQAEIRAQEQARINKMLHSDFFKLLYSRVLEGNKKHVVALIKSGYQITKTNAFLALNITHSALSFYDNGATSKFDFNELGYKALSNQELEALAGAFRTVGYQGQYDEGYYLLYPVFEYWDKATGEIIKEHNSKFKDVI